jgi:hypothetical protein
MIIDLYVLDRATCAIKGFAECHTWQISADYLTDAKSQFAVNMPVEIGDIVIAKRQVSSDILYGGIIGSVEDSAVDCSSLLSLLNMDVPMVAASGNNLQQKIVSYISAALSDPGLNISGKVTIAAGGDPVAWSYAPSDPPTLTNLSSWLSDMAVKYGVYWLIDTIEQDGSTVTINTKITTINDALQIKNNHIDFGGWEVYVNPAGYGQENRLDIYSNDQTAPELLATWYIQPDGTLTQSLTGVTLPVRQKGYIYDAAQENPPTYLEIARSELSASQYSHEINFDAILSSKIVDTYRISIGTIVSIMYNGTMYTSVVTGYGYNSGSNYKHIICGHVRSTLQAVIDNQNQKRR